VLLLVIARRFHDRLLPGDIALLYFIWYPGVRFFLEFLRLDPWTAGGVPLAQWLAGACVLGATALLIWRHNRDAVLALVRR
jgi:prolipoprotein diacylglyceryltransferase